MSRPVFRALEITCQCELHVGIGEDLVYSCGLLDILHVFHAFITSCACVRGKAIGSVCLLFVSSLVPRPSHVFQRFTHTRLVCQHKNCQIWRFKHQSDQ